MSLPSTPTDHLLTQPLALYSLLRALPALAADEGAEELRGLVEDSVGWLRCPMDFEVGGEGERKKIEEDKSLSQETKSQITFLSTYLHISPLLSLSLLHHASTHSSTTHNRSPLITSIKTFHDLISTRLECLKILLGLKTTFILEEDGSNSDTWKIISDTWEYIYPSEPSQLTRFTLASNPNTTLEGLFPSITHTLSILSTQLAETLPTAQRLPQATELPEDVQVFRVRSLRKHMRAVVKVGYVVAASGEMQAGDVAWVVKWLQGREEVDGVVVMMIATFLAAIQHSSLDVPHNEAFRTFPHNVQELVRNPGNCQVLSWHTVTSFYSQQNPWKQEWIHQILTLAWGLFIDKAYSAERHGLQLGKIFERGAETAIQGAIQNDAFRFILQILMPSLDVPASAWPGLLKAQTDKGIPLKMRDMWPILEDPEEDEYQKDTLRQVDLLVKDVVGSFSILKKVKNREDDRAKTVEVRAAREEKPQGQVQEEEDEVRQDFAMFVELVIALYRELPLDHDDFLWRDTRLLRAVGDVDGEGTADKALLIRLLAAIGSGRGGSENLFAYLCKDDSYLNFEYINGALGHVLKNKPATSKIAATALAARLNINGQNVAPIFDPEIQAVDSAVFADICDMLATILRWHPQVSTEMQALHQLLWKLVNRNLPSRLASAILGVLAAFASPAVYSINSEAVKVGYAALRAYNVLTGKARVDATRPIAVFSTSVEEPNSAWLTSIEDNDVSEGVTAGRQAVVKLFENLVVVADLDEALGSDSVVAEVRAKLAEYVLQGIFPAAVNTITGGNPDAGYPLLLAVLSFFQRSLAGLDLNRLLDNTPSSNVSSATSPQDRLIAVQKQPGFVLLRAVLVDQNLRYALFTAAALRRSLELPETVPTDLFTKISFRAVHIIRSIMSQQTILLDVIVPSLRKLGGGQHQKADLLSEGIRPIDWYLAQQPQHIAKIASYVVSEMPDALATAAISLLASLTSSTHLQVPLLVNGRTVSGNLMASVFRDAEHSPLILAGFVDRLDNGSSVVKPHTMLPARLVKDYVPEIELPVPGTAIQLQILDLLLANTQADQPEVTFAHFLLGFLDEPRGGYQLIQRLLREGPQHGTVYENGQIKEIDRMIPRSCFHSIVDRLAKSLPAATDDESADKLSILASGAEVAAKCTALLRQLVEHEATGELTSRYLRGQEDLVYRALRNLPVTPESTGHGENGVCIYANGSSLTCEGKDMVDLFRYQAEVLALVAMEIHHLGSDSDEVERLVQLLLSGSTAPRTEILLDVLSRFNYRWQWQQSAEPNSAGFETVNFAAYIEKNDEGQTTYNIGGLDSALRAEIRRIGRKSAPQERLADLETNRHQIIAHLRRKNLDVDMAIASRMAMKSWSLLLAAVLANRDILPIPSMLDLCDVILVTLNSPEKRGAAEIYDLALALMELSGKLADQLGSRPDSGASEVSPTRLRSIFTALVASIFDDEKGEVSRGILYAAITRFLKNLFSQIPASEIASPQSKSLIAAVLHSLSDDLDRVLTVVSRDAIGASTDWRTVAYTLLDELLVSLPGDFDRAVQILARRGILHNILGAIVSGDAPILANIQSDPDSGMIMILKAQLACLSRLPISEQGAQSLVQAGLFQAIGACAFVGSRPDSDMIAHDAMALDRYYEAVLPVLRLLVDVSATAGDAGYKAIAAFVESQQLVLSLFFDADFVATTASGLEAANLVAKFLLTVAEMESLAFKSATSALNGYSASLRQITVFAVGEHLWNAVIGPSNLREEDAVRDMVLENHDTIDCQTYTAKLELRLSLLSYMEIVTGKDDFKPLILAGRQLGYDRQALRGGAKFLTLDTATAALHATVKQYTAHSANYLVLDRQISDGLTAVSEEDVAKLAAMRYSGDVDLLSREQKHLFAQEQVGQRLETIASDCETLLRTIEVLLILIHRHIRYYNGLIEEQTSASRRYAGPGSALKIEPDIVLGWHNDIEENLNRLGPSLRAVSSLSIPITMTPDVETRQTYLTILAESTSSLEAAGRVA